VSVLQQPYATLGNLERLGVATKALQGLPVLTRRDALKSVSGLMEPYLQKRHKPPFEVEHDPDFDDLSGMTGGAVPIWSLEPAGPVTPGGQARPMDVLVAFPAGGTVGVAGITYCVTAPDAGAYNSQAVPVMPPGPTLPFPVSGIVTIGGYPFQLPIGATVNPGDSLCFMLRTDAGLTGACSAWAAYVLLNARGTDPKTQETLAAGKVDAVAWCKAVAGGEADIDKSAGSNPKVQHGGTRFKHGPEQQDAYAWVRGGRRR
jgi:hypothetical protein